ncbi:MAG TPA: helix-hairpin-helix domain-containing protein [Geomonas sp.]
MVQTTADLEQLKGVGKVLAKRLYDAGFDSFAKIAQAGEEGLKKVRGVNPRYLGSILEQARQLSETAHTGRQARVEVLKQRLTEVKEQVQVLTETTRQRFQEELSGKSGKKLTSDLVRIEDALEQMNVGGKKKSKRAGKALIKAQKRVAGLEDASLKKVHKGLKRARKTMLRALR